MQTMSISIGKFHFGDEIFPLSSTKMFKNGKLLNYDNSTRFVYIFYIRLEP